MYSTFTLYRLHHAQFRHLAWSPTLFCHPAYFSYVYHCLTLFIINTTWLFHNPVHHPAQLPSCHVPSPCTASIIPHSITLCSLHHAPFHHPAQPPSCPIPSPCVASTMHSSITLHIVYCAWYITLHSLHPVQFYHPAQPPPCPVPPPCMADSADISMNRL